ncbi:hypothetical protein AB6A40_007794 [Gnathostoma spinigerum]|uniref:Uncharacterized protein n=1 Tax=Gnathostoma spinigerum TaxID=75299 RepID=A0ABD6ENI9_9BILA
MVEVVIEIVRKIMIGHHREESERLLMIAVLRQRNRVRGQTVHRDLQAIHLDAAPPVVVQTATIVGEVMRLRIVLVAHHMSLHHHRLLSVTARILLKLLWPLQLSRMLPLIHPFR